MMNIGIIPAVVASRRSPSNLQRWILAIRPRTLPAAIAPVVVGWSLAARFGQFKALPALATLACALLLQIGANLINDVVDYEKGLDTGERLGPLRVTQSGLLSSRQVWTGVFTTFGLAALFGFFLVWSAGWAALIIGLACILVAVCYTTGPYPLAYHGLGDLAALVFFGWISVCGTAWAVGGVLPLVAWLCGLGVGALVVNILVINNTRDMESDQRAGRKNIPVIFGQRGSMIEYTIMQVVSYLVPLLAFGLGFSSLWVLLPFLTLAEAASLNQNLRKTPPGKAYNPLLGRTARQALVYSVLLAVGIVL
jgi:1,4-dihydroxy-2-naphthoate polyprenyltransferase